MLSDIVATSHKWLLGTWNRASSPKWTNFQYDDCNCMASGYSVDSTDLNSNLAGMMEHTCNPSTWQAETGDSGVQDQTMVRRTCLKNQSQKIRINSKLTNQYGFLVLA